eukprot:TRINITY_DN21307_c0_g2_i1.p1 TRINITY_DN21307_c0_g2~~TRINITY_DN21307_c0_g2_i1.p1  ORF type:complete len:398 (+),score=82.71 TRINITY_DN21307_c0_g2_i1:211-1404(+)
MFGLPSLAGTLLTDDTGCLTDIDGESICMPQLCAQRLVLVCTFKAVPCPVCPEQMRRLMREPLKSFFRETQVQFIVLCPGPLAGLRASRESLKPALGQESVPFICDEDLSIARSVQAELGFGQIMPCFFEVKPNLRVGWSQIGRGPGHFGDEQVVDFVLQVQRKAWETLEEAFLKFEAGLDKLQQIQKAAPVSFGPGSLPPGLLETCLQLLTPATRRGAAASCRDWRLSLRMVNLREASACHVKARELRSGAHVLQETAALKEGRGRLQQQAWIVDLVGPEGEWNGCLGNIVCIREDGRKYEVSLPRSGGQVLEVEAKSLQAPPWAGLSVPEMQAAAEQLASQLRGMCFETEAEDGGAKCGNVGCSASRRRPWLALSALSATIAALSSALFFIVPRR